MSRNLLMATKDRPTLVRKNNMFKLRSASTLPYYLPHAATSYLAVRSHSCPVCHGGIERIRRRWIDRVVSLVLPMQRYRCQSRGWGCEWEGNLRY